ncbi:hypothetical protein GH714_018018 [Hevea brasiliensis]|uniref:Uncharacterized protein n=1 Tax=Hevea brasiliensis TaxID=3981 RepID=A0A6A6N570_HEVBR|nr:hypothetical protein GH714_018018 [Hevea brasiliensis]
MERRLDEIVDHLDTLEINGNRDRVDNRRPRDDTAHGDPIEWPIVALRHPVYIEDSERRMNMNNSLDTNDKGNMGGELVVLKLKQMIMMDLMRSMVATVLARSLSKRRKQPKKHPMNEGKEKEMLKAANSDAKPIYGSVLGQEIVKSLGLPIKKHPNPYNLGWIKATTSTIKLNERCKGSFSIGQYKYDVYCDVVDIDVGHLLFRRPRQYDVNAQHSGRTDTYSIEKEGVNYSLLPLKNKSTKKEVQTFLPVTKEFEAEAKETKHVHALFVKQILMEESKIPSGGAS